MIAIVCLTLLQAAPAQMVTQIEPPCWWSGMKSELQLLVRGENLRDCSVRVAEEGMTVTGVHSADSPDYLFVDVEITRPGSYTLIFGRGRREVRVPYEIHSRRDGSAEREGFNSSDVIYLIMPDRFANGDPSNDVVEGNSQIVDRSDMSVRHGGDIQGIIDHLDYLADLGVTAIWTTPVMLDELYYHQYGVTDFYRIDPHLGSNELYREYVARAHEKGIRVIQDITPQHCGIGHWWVENPPFHDWINPMMMDGNFWERFALAALSDPHASQGDARFVGSNWLFSTMPDNNLTNPFFMRYLAQMAIWWIEYADLDGYRVDTYFYMGKEAAQWTKAITDEYPRFSLVGEVWETEPAILSYWVGSTDNYDGYSTHLPMVMDFPLQRALATDLAGKGTHWGGRMREIYTILAQDFLYKRPELSQVVFADNHDMSRIYSTLDEELSGAKLAMTLITTTRGIPQIFYGTELLFGNDPDEPDESHRVRPDFPGGWPGDEVNLFLPGDRTPDQQEMFDHTRTLLHYRKKTPLLHTGRLMHYVPQNGLYIYFRYDDSRNDGSGYAKGGNDEGRYDGSENEGNRYEKSRSDESRHDASGYAKGGYGESECVMVIINASESEQPVEWERFEQRLTGRSSGINILDNSVVTTGTPLQVAARTSMVIHFR